MRVGIVGSGKMGGEIASIAAARGHHVVWALGSAENRAGSGLTPDRLQAADLVFEFTEPEAAVENLLVLAAAGARAVCGTTGWTRDLPRVTEAFLGGPGALVYAANFSVAVRHFFDLYPEWKVSWRLPSGFNRTAPGSDSRGWVSEGYFGLDQGLAVLMIENHRSGLIWKLMRGSPAIRLGLVRAGFEGGWL